MSVKSVQAPSKGINQYDSFDDMEEGYALILDNWIADPGRCRLRRGSQTLQNFGAPLRTIMSYGEELIVAAAGKLWEAGLTYTGGLPVAGTPTELGTGYGSDSWQWVGFNNLLLMVNGADVPKKYDGMTISDLNFTSGITGPEDLIGVIVFKGRVFYWKDEAGFYYAEAGSYQGTMAYFDLSLWASKKAKLKTIFTWSTDAGDGADDYAVFLMDTGEALVYQGADPSSITDWELVGKYQMGIPLSIRGTTSIAGDELVITRLGWQNFGVVWDGADFKDDGLGRYVAGLAAQAVDEYENYTGWEVHFFPEERLVIINVPVGSGKSIQHVMNTNTTGWSTFSGWPASTFGNFNGQIVFGTENGDLRVGMIGWDDDGNAIIGDSLPAFNYLSTRAMNKHLTGVRAMTTLDVFDAIELEGAADFFIPDPPVLNISPPPFEASAWGDAWGSPWTTRQKIAPQGVWIDAQAHGYAMSYRMRLAAVGQDVFWYSSQMMYSRAGEV